MEDQLGYFQLGVSLGQKKKSYAFHFVISHHIEDKCVFLEGRNRYKVHLEIFMYCIILRLKG